MITRHDYHHYAITMIVSCAGIALGFVASAAILGWP
jgi:hypothetical protein